MDRLIETVNCVWDEILGQKVKNKCICMADCGMKGVFGDFSS